MTCEQGLLRLLWGGPRSWSATALPWHNGSFFLTPQENLCCQDKLAQAFLPAEYHHCVMLLGKTRPLYNGISSWSKPTTQGGDAELKFCLFVFSVLMNS